MTSGPRVVEYIRRKDVFFWFTTAFYLSCLSAPTQLAEPTGRATFWLKSSNDSKDYVY